jgi:hypothetical protein
MPRRVDVDEGFADAETAGAAFNGSAAERPESVSIDELLAMDLPEPEFLIEHLLPKRGVSMLVGPTKAGKTLLAVQIAVSVASGRPVFDYYSVDGGGPVLVVEVDDVGGASSLRGVLRRYRTPVAGLPVRIVTRLPFPIGPALFEWLESEIKSRKLRLVVLDSYTALRSSRGNGCDIVKVEQTELAVLYDLAVRADCSILLLHHDSKAGAKLDNFERGAGTYAVNAAPAGQITIARFAELDGPERLVRARTRHAEDIQMVLRLEKESLEYKHVMEGGAAGLYPLLAQIRANFEGDSFGPKRFAQLTGFSPAHTHRIIAKLHHAGAIEKRGFGEYVLAI